MPTEINLSDGERRLFDVPSVSTSGVQEWVAEIETLFDYTQHLADGRSRLKREENYEVVRT